VKDHILRFPHISPISQLDSEISRSGRDRQERQRHIEIGEEELDARRGFNGNGRFDREPGSRRRPGLKPAQCQTVITPRL
jgi:hypothetical protein